jgi:hypothetical protein
MDDSDLQWNYQMYRRKYWAKYHLWIPEEIEVVFGKFKNVVFRARTPKPIAVCLPNRIIIAPSLRSLYFAAHITLLHEMAHLYIGFSKGWKGRSNNHGKLFQAEIDRLWSLGAFRKLI